MAESMTASSSCRRSSPSATPGQTVAAITCILIVPTPACGRVCGRGCGCVSGRKVGADLDVAGGEGHVVSRKLLRVARDPGLHLLHLYIYIDIYRDIYIYIYRYIYMYIII